MADYPNPPDDDFATTDLSPMLKRAQQIVRDVAAVSCYSIPPAVSFPPLPPTGMTDLPMTEAEFLGRPHPKTVAHTAAVVERVQALTPPSLVRMDRAETALAAVVARRKLEQAGQFQTDQWWDLKRYEDGLVDNYIEATS